MADRQTGCTVAACCSVNGCAHGCLRGMDRATLQAHSESDAVGEKSIASPKKGLVGTAAGDFAWICSERQGKESCLEETMAVDTDASVHKQSAVLGS